MRSLICFIAVLSIPLATAGEDPSPSEKAIREAIKLLETKRDAIDDTIEAAKIDKAIRDLEALVEDPEGESKPSPITFTVTPATLKKKFAGKPVFTPKTGELTLTYDFANKSQLADFKVDDLKVQVAKKLLVVEGGDSLQHVAHFRTFTVSGLMTIKSMRGGVGIGSRNGTLLSTAGVDTVQLKLPNGIGERRVVRNELRSGSIPVSFSITANKATIRYGTEQLTKAIVKTDDIQQVVINAGTEGCAFSNLVITGIPDPAWFKEFLGE